MDLRTALARSRELLVEHGLGQWRLKTINSRNLYGQCDSATRTIEISTLMIAAAPDLDIVEQTMLHEIAHALTPVSRSSSGRRILHGDAWLRQARAIGYRYDRNLPDLPDLSSAEERAFDEEAIKLVAGVDIVVGDRIKFINGTTGTVTGLRRVFYSVILDDGRDWVVRFGHVLKSVDQTPFTPPPLEIVGVGEQIKVLHGSRAIPKGRLLTVFEVQDGKYLAFNSRRKRFVVPFRSAERAS